MFYNSYMYTLNSLSNHFAATYFRRSPITALAVNAEPAPGPLNMNGYSLYNAVCTINFDTTLPTLLPKGCSRPYDFNPTCTLIRFEFAVP